MKQNFLDNEKDPITAIKFNKSLTYLAYGTGTDCHDETEAQRPIKIVVRGTKLGY